MVHHFHAEMGGLRVKKRGELNNANPTRKTFRDAFDQQGVHRTKQKITSRLPPVLINPHT
jgi:hypothetical protein